MIIRRLALQSTAARKPQKQPVASSSASSMLSKLRRKQQIAEAWNHSRTLSGVPMGPKQRQMAAPAAHSSRRVSGLGPGVWCRRDHRAEYQPRYARKLTSPQTLKYQFPARICSAGVSACAGNQAKSPGTHRKRHGLGTSDVQVPNSNACTGFHMDQRACDCCSRPSHWAKLTTHKSGSVHLPPTSGTTPLTTTVSQARPPTRVFCGTPWGKAVFFTAAPCIYDLANASMPVPAISIPWNHSSPRRNSKTQGAHICTRDSRWPGGAALHRRSASLHHWEWDPSLATLLLAHG